MSLNGAKRRQIPENAIRTGTFLERDLPLVAFVTLTVPNFASRMRLETSFTRWLEGVQQHNRLTLGWIRAFEPNPQLHIHAVLLASGPVDCEHAPLLWQQVTGVRNKKAAEVEPYTSDRGGLAYVLKSLDSNPEDIAFSHNLSAFAQHSDIRFFGRNAGEQRHIRRIRAQARAITANAGETVGKGFAAALKEQVRR